MAVAVVKTEVNPLLYLGAIGLAGVAIWAVVKGSTTPSGSAKKKPVAAAGGPPPGFHDPTSPGPPGGRPPGAAPPGKAAPKEPNGPPPPGFRSVSPSSSVFGSGSATTFTGGPAPYVLTLRVATSGGEMAWSDPLVFEGRQRDDGTFDAPETSMFGYLHNIASQGWDGVWTAFSTPVTASGFGAPGDWFTGSFGKDHPAWGFGVTVVVDGPASAVYAVA